MAYSYTDIGHFQVHTHLLLCICDQRFILSTFEQIEIFALPNRRFNKLSNDTKFVKIEVILYKVCIFFYFPYILHTILLIISE